MVAAVLLSLLRGARRLLPQTIAVRLLAALLLRLPMGAVRAVAHRLRLLRARLQLFGACEVANSQFTKILKSSLRSRRLRDDFRTVLVSNHRHGDIGGKSLNHHGL
jgi:hypothetical protein